MQQVVHPRQLVTHQELLFEDADQVPASQHAHAVIFGRPGEHALPERLVLLRRQLRGSARRGLGRHRRQAMIAVGVAPALHEPARSAQHPHDVRCGFPGGRQPHRPQPVTLFGVTGPSDQIGQFRRVAVLMQSDVDSKAP